MQIISKPKSLAITESNLPLSHDIDARSLDDLIKILLPSHNNQKDLKELIGYALNSIKQGGRIIYIGAGSSGRIGFMDAIECEPTYGQSEDTIVALIAGGQQALYQAVEGAEDNTKQSIEDLNNIALSKNDILIGLSASGTTPYVLSALNHAHSIHCKTVLICNNITEANNFDQTVFLNSGPEIICGSTRMQAGTALKIFLNAFSTASMIQLGHSFGNLMVDMKPANQKLSKRQKHIFQLATGKNIEAPTQDKNRQNKVQKLSLKENILLEKYKTFSNQSTANIQGLIHTFTQKKHMGIGSFILKHVKLKNLDQHAFIFDMDGSMLSYHLKNGFSTWAALGWAYDIFEDMQRWVQDYKDKNIAYEDIWTLCAQKIKNKDSQQLHNTLFSSAGSPPLNRGLRHVLPLLIQNTSCGILSSGLHASAEYLKNHFKLDFQYSNEFVQSNGVFTGEVKLNVPFTCKLDLYKKILKQHKLENKHIVYVGDSENDFEILDQATHPIFIQTQHNQHIVEKARKHNWTVINDYYDLLLMFSE